MGWVSPHFEERQVDPHSAGCSLANTKLQGLFSARLIPSSQHLLPASVAVVLTRAPKNIFIVTGGVF